MFQERQTTHFATVITNYTAGTDFSFIKDEYGDKWAMIKGEDGNVLNLNFGKNPIVKAYTNIKHAKSGVKLTVVTPIVGQTYIVDLEIPEFLSYADQDVYHITGTAYAKTTEASLIYKGLAETMISINKSLVRNTGYGLIEVSAGYSTSSSVAITSFKGEFNTSTSYVAGDVVISSGKAYVFTTTHSSGAMSNDASEINALYITEATQEWQIGFIEQKFVDIRVDHVRPGKIVVNGNPYYDWLTVTDATESSASVSMTKSLADMEFQYIANRYDVQLNNNRQFMSKILDACKINTSKEYDIIHIKGTYRGDGHAVQENYFELIIACDADSGNTPHTVANTLIGDTSTAHTLKKSDGWASDISAIS